MTTATRAPRRLTAGARRQAILTAAKQVFGSHGYHATTTRDIAAAAGVSEALLYQHFDGKRQLFEHVVHGAAGELERRIEAATAGADPSSMPSRHSSSSSRRRRPCTASSSGRRCR